MGAVAVRPVVRKEGLFELAELAPADVSGRILETVRPVRHTSRRKELGLPSPADIAILAVKARPLKGHAAVRPLIARLE